MDLADLGNVSKIIAEGRLMLSRAYAPYSEFQVGAVVVSSDDKTFSGCNIENSSYALTVCAEVAAISQMVSSGIQNIKAIFVFSNSSQFVTPCGACRQKISEFAKPEVPVFLVNQQGKIRQHSLSALMPMAFNLQESETTS